MRLDGKIALITGASSGIGRAIAECFEEEGCDLAINGRNEMRLKEVSEQIKRKGRNVLFLKGDVAIFEKVQQMGEKTTKTLGRVDILVNNAGMGQEKTIMEMNEMDWDLTISVNLKSAFNWVKAVLPTMLSNGYGKIINISSVIAKTGAGRFFKAAYAASEAGLPGLTPGLAKEVGPKAYVNSKNL
jgi:3-oxoacyl-[acyl-carrier protein] reductase